MSRRTTQFSGNTHTMELTLGTHELARRGELRLDDTHRWRLSRQSIEARIAGHIAPSVEGAIDAE